MRQIIRNERRCELALEGLRWYDIKRWKAGKEYLEGYVYGANFNNGNPIRLDKRQFDEKQRLFMGSSSKPNQPESESSP